MDRSADTPAVAEAPSQPVLESLTETRGFWSLIATQFQVAFSDNVLRNLLLSMIVGMSLARVQRETFVSTVTVIFSVPFLLFSMLGGWLADRYSKRRVTIWTKWLEVLSMTPATVGLATPTRVRAARARQHQRFAAPPGSDGRPADPVRSKPTARS